MRRVFVFLLTVVEQRQLTGTFLQRILLQVCRCYNVISSSANHSLFSIFVAYSATANGGRKVLLLRGSGTRMAFYLYAMMRLLCLKDVLASRVYGGEINSLKLSKRAQEVIKDIKNLAA